MTSQLIKRCARGLRNALSSCEPGWLSTAFLLPAVLGSLALLLYVASLSQVPVELFDAGEEGTGQGAVAVQTSDVPTGLRAEAAADVHVRWALLPPFQTWEP